MKMIISLTALGVALSASPVFAQDPAPEGRVQIVHYADLDLRSDAGLAILDRRIRSAVRNACGTASDTNIEGKNEVRRCRTTTRLLASRQREEALASVSRPSSTLYASER